MTNSILNIDTKKTFEFSKILSSEDVESFAIASGDTQPLHLDDSQASKTRFKKRIAHGILTAGVISAAIGTQIAPGQVVIYMNQSLKFLGPVYIGDTVTAKLNVISINAPRKTITLKASVINQSGDEILSGQSEVMIEPYED
jgi:3-hydroxybutyryl-CoA dehydratase